MLEDTIQVNKLVQQQKPLAATSTTKKTFFAKCGGRTGPRSGFQGQGQGFRMQRGRGSGRGWQNQQIIQSPQSQNKTGSQHRGQLTKN